MSEHDALVAESPEQKRYRIAKNNFAGICARYWNDNVDTETVRRAEQELDNAVAALRTPREQAHLDWLWSEAKRALDSETLPMHDQLYMLRRIVREATHVLAGAATTADGVSDTSTVERA
jgi:hypothetical protein